MVIFRAVSAQQPADNKMDPLQILPGFDVEFVVELDDVVTYLCDLGQAAPLLIFQVPNMILYV